MARDPTLTQSTWRDQRQTVRSLTSFGVDGGLPAVLGEDPKLIAGLS
jgi:hypothetical protein